MEDRQMIVSVKNVAYLVGQGGYWSRADIARRMGRDKTTHVVATIERAAQQGLINKIFGQDDHGRFTWLYTIEVQQERLPE